MTWPFLTLSIIGGVFLAEVAFVVFLHLRYRAAPLRFLSSDDDLAESS
jgi:hypothetical protein